jgi:hypothetical protein
MTEVRDQNWQLRCFRLFHKRQNAAETEICLVISVICRLAQGRRLRIPSPERRRALALLGHRFGAASG